MKNLTYSLKLNVICLIIVIFLFSNVVSFLPDILLHNTLTESLKIKEARAAAIAYRASGIFTPGAGPITPPYAAGMAAGDICLLVVESENQAITLTTANGFVQVPTWSPRSAGTAGVNPASRLAVFWKRTVGGDSPPLVADSGDHTTGQIHCFSGVTTSGNPWDTGAGGNDGAVNDTTGTIPGAITSTTDTLVVLITSTSNNATISTNCSGWTNADLTGITERTDNSNTINLGGGHCLATGIKTSAGAYTTTTLTMSATTFKGAISLALKSEFPATGNIISSTFDTLAANAVTYNSILWKGTKPLGTNVRLQLATSINPAGPFTFIGGATCTSGDYYELSSDQAANIKCFSSFNNNNRYFRYKAILCPSSTCTSSGSQTPQIDDVIVNWSP